MIKGGRQKRTETENETETETEIEIEIEIEGEAEKETAGVMTTEDVIIGTGTASALDQGHATDERLAGTGHGLARL